MDLELDGFIQIPISQPSWASNWTSSHSGHYEIGSYWYIYSFLEIVFTFVK